MPPFASVAGTAVQTLVARIPNRGPWYVEAELGEKVALSGRVEVAIGSLRLAGTVDPSRTGTFAESTQVRVIAGAGGWAKKVKPKDYHNDARVKARTVAEDAAREAGETIGTFVPAAERVGIDYVRAEVQASQLLEIAIGDTAWWVDFAGKTNVGPRASKSAKDYDLVSFAAKTQVAVLTADDPAAVEIGAILDDERLGGQRVVRQIDITVEGEELRIHAWCGNDAGTDARLVRVLSEIAKHATGGKLYGIYRYRVVQMNGDRVELQAISRAAGLPDILPIDMHPGVAGAHSQLTNGSEVHVQFVEGSPTMPVVTGFGQKGSPGASPVRTTVDAQRIDLGSAAALGAARQQDTVVVLLPPANLAGMLAPGSVIMPNGVPNPTPIPITGTVIWPTQTTGTIATCSNKTFIQ